MILSEKLYIEPPPLSLSALLLESHHLDGRSDNGEHQFEDERDINLDDVDLHDVIEGAFKTLQW